MTRLRFNRYSLSLLVASAAAIAVLTLQPDSGRGGVPTSCVLCGEHGSADLILNVLLFAPLGFALGRAGGRPILVAGLGLCLAFGIELAQIAIPGRAPTWRDAVLNGIGAGLGAFVAQQASGWIRGRAALPLAWISAAAAVLAIPLTAALLIPAPRDIPWYGHWTPRLGHLGRWDGTLSVATLGGRSVAHGFLEETAEVRARVLARDTLVLRGIAAPTPTRLAPIFGISDDEYEEALLVGQDGSSLVYRERRRASDLRLFEPEFRLPAFLSGLEPGTPFTLTLAPTNFTLCARLEAPDTSRDACAGPFAASSLWTAVLWRRWLTSAWHAAFGALTLLTLVFPVACFAVGSARRAAAPAVLLAIVGIVLLAPGLGLASLRPSEWAGLLLGCVSGAGVGYLVRRAARTSL